MTAPGILEQCIGNGMTGVATTSAMAGGLALTAAACGTGAGIAAVIGVVAGSCILVLGMAFAYLGGKVEIDCTNLPWGMSMIGVVVVSIIAVAMEVIPPLGFILAVGAIMGGLLMYIGAISCITDQCRWNLCLPDSWPRVSDCFREKVE